MPFHHRAAVIAALVTLAGCGEPEPDAAVGRATIDTTNVTAIDGLSAEQLQRRAEPVDVIEAERLGLPTLDPDSAPPSAP